MKKYFSSILLSLVFFLINVPLVKAVSQELINTPLYTDPNLVAYWRMEGNSNDSKGSHNGSDTSIVYNSSYGMFGQGAGLNGTTSYIGFSGNPTTATNNFTIVAWIYPTLPNAWGAIYFNGRDDYGWGLGVGGGSGNNHLQGLYANIAMVDANVVVANQTWQHVALVRRSGTNYLYLNGVEYAAGTATPSTPYPISTIGMEVNSYNNNTNFYSGALDDAAVFDRALTAAEIQSLYNAGPTPTPTPTSTPTPTPTPTPAPSIGVLPSSATVTAGTPFNVDVIVDGGGQAFNAAQATVTVSSGLSITGLHNPSSNTCNFQYTQTPSASNPSFAGAIYASSSTNCKVYTLTLTPSGSGTITLTNASIKAYTNNSEILSTVQNGTFTMGTPTPTPTPSGTIASIDDSVQGTGQNQWNYTGSGWSHCTNCNDTATFFNASASWSNTTNDSVTLPFTGTQVKFYGVTDPRYGIAAFSIDNGAETNVDFYSSIRIGNVLLWTSPTLSNSSHTLKLRVTGTHNTNATDNYVVVDRADILSTAILNVAINTYPLDTYSSSLQITGIKEASITQVFVNGSDANTTYPTNTTWQAQISLASFGTNTFVIYGKDANQNQTASLNMTINKHTIADINGDGVVNLTDASLFAVDWGKTSNLTYPLSDMNGDGSVDLTDLSILAKLITP